MRNTNRFFLQFLVLIFFIIVSNSCANYKGNYVTNTIVKPVDVNRLEGKWIIDEPVLEKIDISYETTVLEYYQDILGKKFKTLKSIREFNNISSLKNATENNLNTLDFYKQKTLFDYLISTKIKLVKVDNDKLTKELYAKIITYDLNTKKIIFEKEYIFKDTFTGLNDSPFSSNLKRFLTISIKDCIKEFGNDKNWKTTDKS
jgi:hypothetical protein